jgi:mannosyltransferase OCH1-like enzyme
LRRYKLPDILQIPTELTQAGGKILLSEVHKLIDSIWRTEELPPQWKDCVIFIRRESSDYDYVQNLIQVLLLRLS